MTQNDITMLKNFSVSREFEAVKRLQDEMIDNWTRQLSTGTTEFEYLRASFERDGKIVGVRALILDIERLR